MSESTSNKRGFTLIELLTVISIIGLLFSVVLSATSIALTKGRDAKRISDIRQISNALALYYETNGFYPTSSGSNNPANGYNSTDSSWDMFQINLNDYMPKLPVDPINQIGWAGNGDSYNYSYIGGASLDTIAPGCSGQQYVLVYRLENPPSNASQGIVLCDGYRRNYITDPTYGVITTGNNINNTVEKTATPPPPRGR